MNTNETKPSIIQCIVIKLSERDSLEYLAKKGHKINRKHFYRLKKDIKDSRFNRLTLIAKSQFVDQHLERIDQLELINRDVVPL